MKKRKAKKIRLKKEQLHEILELRRKYDELQADCKDLCSIVAGFTTNIGEVACIEFNDTEGWPHLSAQMLYDYFRRIENGKEV